MSAVIKQGCRCCSSINVAGTKICSPVSGNLATMRVILQISARNPLALLLEGAAFAVDMPCVLLESGVRGHMALSEDGAIWVEIGLVL